MKSIDYYNITCCPAFNEKQMLSGPLHYLTKVEKMIFSKFYGKIDVILVYFSFEKIKFYTEILTQKVELTISTRCRKTTRATNLLFSLTFV